MNKSCIFNNNKLCNNCGECEACDLYPSKICDSCGKCMNMNNLDMKVINIDEIQEDEVEFNVTDDLDSEEVFDKSSVQSITYNESDDFSENLDSWDLIDDMEGLNEILNDTENFNDRAVELFPGLIVIKK
jgi:hypothetical protein